MVTFKVDFGVQHQATSKLCQIESHQLGLSVGFPLAACFCAIAILALDLSTVNGSPEDLMVEQPRVFSASSEFHDP